MANNVNIGITTDTKGLKSVQKEIANTGKTTKKQIDDLVRNLESVFKLISKHNIKRLSKNFMGIFTNYKGNFKENDITKFLSKFGNTDKLATLYNRRLNNILPILNDPAFAKMSRLDKTNFLEKKLPVATYGNIEAQNQLLKAKQSIKFWKDLTKNELEDPFKNLKTIYKDLQKAQLKLDKKVTQKAKDYKKSMEGIANPMSGIKAEMWNKVKTVGLYYSVVSAWNFMKDVVNLRKEYETNAILISRALTKFPEFNGNTQSQNLGAARKLIKELRGIANDLGIEYGEIEKNFAKLANAIPKGSLSLAQVKDTYSGILKLFTVTGATAEEQTNALRAFTQMIEKGTLSAEEFNRQLGNTPLRSVVLEYGLQAMNKRFGLNLTNFEQMQSALKQKNITSDQFIYMMIQEAKKDPKNKENLYGASIAGSMARLTNAIRELKESFTKGFGIFNPALSTFGTLTDSMSGLIRIIASIVPVATTFLTGYSLYGSMSRFGEFASSFKYGKKGSFMRDYDSTFLQYFLKVNEAHDQGDSDKVAELRSDFSRRMIERTMMSAMTMGHGLSLMQDIWTKYKVNELFKGDDGKFSAWETAKQVGMGAFGLAEFVTGATDVVRALQQLHDFSEKVKKLTLAIESLTLIEKLRLVHEKGKEVLTATSKTIGTILSLGFASGPVSILIGSIAMAATALYGLYKLLSGDEEKEKEKENYGLVSEGSLIRSRPNYGINSYAQVDVRADFPVQSTSVDIDGLSVNIFGSLQPGNNL